jgi:hypothetical protein
VDEADPVRVEISEPDDKTVLVSITDRGLGVPKEHFTHSAGAGRAAAGPARWGDRRRVCCGGRQAGLPRSGLPRLLTPPRSV